ncbi:MAG: hypothetical protein WBB74_07720 [Gaiellaceae bacterium]
MHERLRQRVDDRRTRPIGPRLEAIHDDVCDHVGDHDLAEDGRAAPVEREHERNAEPDHAPGADPRQPDEDRIEPPRTVMDDPTLDVPV